MTERKSPMDVYRFLYTHPRVELGLYNDLESLCLAFEMAIYITVDSENRQRRISTQRFVPFDQLFRDFDITIGVLDTMYNELIAISEDETYEHGMPIATTEGNENG